ncbi:MAG TPA: class I SAM-dependent methyltransferase [Streptosporangiaceae bacterium]|nr:class I SAM-dependent methyltransferase [Streptosporangiaceae bacterium]
MPAERACRAEQPTDRADQPAGGERRREQATSFGTAAGAYERGRPPYPAEAIDWLLPPGAARVLDLGAGTGKLTRALLGRGLDVAAVEPLAGMRDELARAVPGAAVRAGTAEHIPLPDGSVDAVLVAQAWHWVDPARAVPEVARVLAPGGQLGLLWNVRDERVAWVAELSRILADPGDAGPASRPGVTSLRGITSPPFGPLERHTVDWVHRLTRHQLADMVASRSYIITMPAAQRDRVLAEVARLADTHPALAGHRELALPYRTECFRTRLG